MPSEGAAQTPRADLTVLRIATTTPVFGADEPVRVTATVKNLGPDATGVPGGEVRFRYNSPDRQLTGDVRSNQPFNLTQPLPVGGTVEVSVDWAPAEAQVGEGSILAIVASPWESSSTSGNNERRLPVHVARYRTDLVLTDDEDSAALPGTSVPYRVNVTNDGNVEARYRLTLEGLPSGWNGTVEPRNLTLAPGQGASVVALVAPPATAEAPTGGNATFNATVTAAHRPWTVLDLPTTRVRDTLPGGFSRAATLTPFTPWTFLRQDPGNTSTLFLLTNQGTEREAYRFAASIEGAIAEAVTAHPARTVALAPGEAATIHVPVEVLEKLSVGDAGTLAVSANPVNADPTDPPTTATHRLVVSGPNLNVTRVVVPEPVYRDAGAVPVAVTVRNEGAMASPASNITVQAIRAGLAVSSADATLTELAAGDETTVTASLRTADLSGTYTIAAIANRAGSFAETTDEDNREDASILVRTVGLRVEPAAPLTLQPGEFARYVRPPHLFQVVNDGNARELVAIEVSSKRGWVSTRETLAIDPGVRTGVPIEFRIPRLPGALSDELQVHARLVNVSGVEATNSSRTLILDTQAPDVVAFDLPDQAEAIIPFVVTAELSDSVGVREAWLTVAPPRGGQERVEMTRTNGDEFRAELSLVELGEHEVRLHAVDRTPENNTYTSLDPRVVMVSYDRRPVIELVRPASGLVRSGVLIELSIEDPAGFAAISASSAGRDLRMGGNQTIDTAGWSEGTFPLEVTATNRYDRTATRTFEITVDNTPPVVAGVRIDPSKPAPSESFTVFADVEGDAVEAVVRISGEGEEPMSVPMREEEGAWRARLDLPAGSFALTVEARDAAGNTGSADRVRELTLGSDSPGPGPLIVLLVVGLAVLARRCRD